MNLASLPRLPHSVTSHLASLPKQVVNLALATPG